MFEEEKKMITLHGVPLNARHKLEASQQIIGIFHFNSYIFPFGVYELCSCDIVCVLVLVSWLAHSINLKTKIRHKQHVTRINIQ